MINFLLFICLALMLASSISAVVFRSLLKSTISLAASSAFLAMALFIMDIHWAALVELSVCAGLITAVFVSTISLTTANRRDEEHSKEHRRRYNKLPFMLIFVGFCLISILVLTNFQITFNPASYETFGEFKDIFWKTRQVDILGQIVVILAGTFAVVVLFIERDE